MQLITIFTPTFNRGYILPELYKSLLSQSNKSFIWLIVDDGSTDNTEELVKSFINDNLITIEYYRQENRGKHVAHNKAVELCTTKLFMCVDSDDRLTENAIEIIHKYYFSFEDENILGFYYRKGTSILHPHGSDIPRDIKYVKIRDLYDLYNFNGEMAIVLFTGKIKGKNFPEFKKEKFITELVFYYQINEVAPMVLLDKVIYLFDYLEDGYTVNANCLNYLNPYGTATSFLVTGFYNKNLLKKIKKIAQFYAWKLVFKLVSNEFNKYEISFKYKLFASPLILYYITLFYVNKQKIINHKGAFE